MIFAIPFLYFPGSSSEDTLAWKAAAIIILILLSIFFAWFIWKGRKNDPVKAELKLLNTIKRMKMDQYELKDKIIEILKNEKVPYKEDPDFENSLSIYIGEKNQLVSLKYLYTKCTDSEVTDKFRQFLKENKRFE